MSTVIYHITTSEAWSKAKTPGFYEDQSLAVEGFIHCSTEEQVAGVLERYFSGKTNLIRLTIDTTKLTAKLQYDLAASVNEYFPHIYGTINLDAVISADEL